MSRSGILAEQDVLGAHYDAIVNAIDDAAYSTDLRGIITSWNRGAERLFGYTAEQAVGQPATILAPNALMDEAEALVQRLRRGEQLEGFETVRQRRDGGRFPVSLTVLPIRDRHGEMIGVSVLGRDITANKDAGAFDQVAVEANTQKRLYETIIASTSDLVYAFDLNYRFIYANDALLEMWGRTWEESSGKRIQEVGYEPWHAEMHEREIDEVVATRQPIRGEVAFPHTKLGRRIYDYIFFPIIGLDGEIEAVGGTTRDVTERHRAEQALRESDERLRFTLEAAEYGHWDLDLTGPPPHTATRSLKHDQIFGYEELLPEWTYERFLQHVVEEDRPHVDAGSRRAIADGEDWDCECRIHRADGALRWIWVRGRPLCTDDGRPRRLIGLVRDITERKREEEVLAADLASNRRLQELSGRLIPADDVETLYRELVDAAVEITQADRGTMQLIDQETGELCLIESSGVPEALRDTFARLSPDSSTSCAVALRTGERVFVDYVTDQRVAGTVEARSHLDAGIRAAQSTPLVTRSGQLVGMLSTHWKTVPHAPDRQLDLLDVLARQAADLIERTQAEQALREGEQQRRVALEAAELGTWNYDIAAERLHWDQRTAALFGRAGLDSVPISEALARIHPDDRAPVERQIANAIDPATNGRYDIEYRVFPSEGEQRWIRVVGQAQFDVERGVRRATGFVGVVFDTTDGRAARQAMEEANERAQRNLGQLEAVLRQMTEGLVIADPSGDVMSMNDAALALHEMADMQDVKQHLSKYESTFVLLDIQTGQPLALEDWPLARSLRGETFTGQEVEVRNQHTGRTWIGSYGGTPVRSPRGDVQLAIVTIRDITEHKQAEQRLQELNESLEHRVAIRTAEARQRADQLQRLAAELAEAEQRERRRLARFLHDDLQQILVAAKMRLAMSSGTRTNTLNEIDHLLAQAMDASRSLTTQLAPPVLYDLGLKKALKWLARWAKDKYGLHVTVDARGPDTIENEAVRVTLFEAVRELLLNIVKHAGTDRANITLRREGDMCHVVVQDSGAGFDLEQCRASKEATGYGLFSLQERLGLTGGRVHVDSAPGRGTRVEVMAPLMPAPPATAPPTVGEAEAVPEIEAAASPSVAGPPADAQRTTIMLTDDHDIVRQGLANLIEQQLDMTIVAEAASGEEAVDLANQHGPDVVVMDVSLPGISGIEATRRIMAEHPRACVIGLSMLDEQDVADAFLAAGGQAFLNKSRAAGELVEAIRDSCPGST